MGGTRDKPEGPFGVQLPWSRRAVEVARVEVEAKENKESHRFKSGLD